MAGGILPMEDVKGFGREVIVPIGIAGGAGLMIDYVLPRIPFIKKLPTTVWSLLTVGTGMVIGGYYLSKEKDVAAYTIGGAVSALGAYKLLSELLAGVVPMAGYGKVLVEPTVRSGERVWPPSRGSYGKVEVESAKAKREKQIVQRIGLEPSAAVEEVAILGG